MDRYLTECHVVFAFISDRVTLPVNIKMWKKLQAYKSSSNEAAVTGRGIVQMPAIQKTTCLSHLVGPDSHELFNVLPRFEILMRYNPSKWQEMDEFKSLRALLDTVPGTNDAL